MSLSKTTKKPTEHAFTLWRSFWWGGFTCLALGAAFFYPVTVLFEIIAWLLEQDQSGWDTAAALWTGGFAGFMVGYHVGERHIEENWDEDERTVELNDLNTRMKAELDFRRKYWTDDSLIRPVPVEVAAVIAEDTRLKKKLATLRT